jgi:hypothetical protein
MMKKERSKPVVEGGGGAMATLLHAAVRLAANRLATFRRAAIFAQTPLREDWRAAVKTLCRKTPTSSKIVDAVRGWDRYEKNARLFAPFHSEHDHFAKTGSGPTYEKQLQKETRFLIALMMALALSASHTTFFFSPADTTTALAQH